jgi:uncharacterized protein
MTDTNLPSIGGVFSADIAVPEHERELRFYSRVLGTGEAPLWREDLMNNLGLPIIGLGERKPEYAQLPLQWMPHIQVADVAASAERALELGGSELMHDKSGDGASQWAVLLDPNGAAFGIIPAEAVGAAPQAEAAAARAGRIAGLELTVPDAPATRDYYRRVIGWTSQDIEVEDADGSYTDFHLLGAEGHPAARVCHSRGAKLGLPAVWMISLPVGDLAESLRRVGEEGGKVIDATRGSDGEFTRAVVQDPVGAFFALVSG